MNFESHKVNKYSGGEAYLFTSGDDAVLVDTGYAIGVEGTIDNIEKFLDGRKLKHIILTHSHYDHVMGSPAISEHFPEAKIYAHYKMGEVFKRPNARKKMEEMNTSAANQHGQTAIEGWSDKLHVDIDAKDGDIIEVGKMRIKIIETPGHTFDAITLYFENEKLLFASESLGVPLDFPGVIPGFIVSYNDAMESIAKVRKLKPEYLQLPHSRIITGDDIDTYFDNGIKEAKRTYDLVMNAHNNGASVDDIVEELKDIYYKANFRKYQTCEAFYANWIPLVTKLTLKES